MEKEAFKQKAEDAVEKQRIATKDFATKIIPTVLWFAASLFTAVNALNNGEGFYVVTGIISIIGAAIFTVKTYKAYKSGIK